MFKQKNSCMLQHMKFLCERLGLYLQRKYENTCMRGTISVNNRVQTLLQRLGTINTLCIVQF